MNACATPFVMEMVSPAWASWSMPSAWNKHVALEQIERLVAGISMQRGGASARDGDFDQREAAVCSRRLGV